MLHTIDKAHTINIAYNVVIITASKTNPSQFSVIRQCIAANPFHIQPHKYFSITQRRNNPTATIPQQQAINIISASIVFPLFPSEIPDKTNQNNQPTSQD
ncbi:hypothetical protein ACR3MX_004244 [Escherichia coli]